MALTVRCTDCQSEYSMADAFLGKRIQCLHCGKVFTITPPPDPGDDLDFRSSLVQQSAKAKSVTEETPLKKEEEKNDDDSDWHETPLIAAQAKQKHLRSGQTRRTPGAKKEAGLPMGAVIALAAVVLLAMAWIVMGLAGRMTSEMKKTPKPTTALEDSPRSPSPLQPLSPSTVTNLSPTPKMADGQTAMSLMSPH